MSTIAGDITRFLAILGESPDASAVTAFVDSFEVEVEEDEMELGDEVETYLILADAGVELNFTDGVLTAVFAYVEGDDEHEAFRDAPSLVDGLTLTEDRDGIRAVLGTPVRSTDAFDLFQVGDRFLHVEYADERPRMLTALLEDVGA
jgi:hypothetical protein